MNKEIQIAELPIIQKITDDEKWLMSELFGCDVGDCQELRNKVTEVVLRCGEEMRENAISSLSS